MWFVGSEKPCIYSVPNRKQSYDIVVGTFLIVGLTEDDFGDLSQELIQRYEKLFHNPEEFDYFTDAQGRTHLDVRPCEPEDNAK